MNLYSLSTRTNKLLPFQGTLRSYPNGNQYVEWGKGDHPTRLQIHYRYPPIMETTKEERVIIPQAHVVFKNRNVLIASFYLKETDGACLLFFNAHFPKDTRKKAAFVLGKNNRVFCDNSRPWIQKGVAIEAAIYIKIGETGIINDTLPNGHQRHYRIYPANNMEPILEIHSGYYQDRSN